MQRESDKLREFSDLQNSLLDRQKRNVDLLLLRKLLQPKKSSQKYLKSKFNPLLSTIEAEYPQKMESFLAKEQHLSAPPPLQSHLDNPKMPIVLKNGDSINIIKNDRKNVFQVPVTQTDMIKELTNQKSNFAHVRMDGLKGVEQEKLRLGKEELKIGKLIGKGNLKKEDLERNNEENLKKLDLPAKFLSKKKGVVGSETDTEGVKRESGGEARKKMTPSGIGNEKVIKNES